MFSFQIMSMIAGQTPRYLLFYVLYWLWVPIWAALTSARGTDAGERISAMDSQAEAIGGRIRARRESLGMTRAELAHRTGLSEDALGLMERGCNSPRIESLFAISDALRVPVLSLLGGHASKPRGRSLAMERLVSYLDRLPEADIRMVHEIARGVLEGKGKRRKR